MAHAETHRHGPNHVFQEASSGRLIVQPGAATFPQSQTAGGLAVPRPFQPTRGRRVRLARRPRLRADPLRRLRRSRGQAESGQAAADRFLRPTTPRCRARRPPAAVHSRDRGRSLMFSTTPRPDACCLNVSTHRTTSPTAAFCAVATPSTTASATSCTSERDTSSGPMRPLPSRKSARPWRHDVGGTGSGCESTRS